MRAYTLALSVIVHLMAIAAVIVTPLVATDLLPLPRRTVEFVSVTAQLPQVPQPQTVRRPRVEASPSETPIVEPTRIEPEIETLPPAPALDIPGAVVGSILSTPEVVVEIAPPEPRPVAPIRIGGAITRPTRTSYVAPAYPAIARSARMEGTVILEAVIDVDGSVKDVSVLRSVALLDQSAIEAVRQWRFTPTRLNGEAVPVVMTVTVTFALQ